MRFLTLSLLLVSALAMTSCANSTGNKQTVGTGVGAILGGIAGSQIGGGSGRLVAVGAGTLLGAFLGSEVGSSLDKADIAYANQAASQAHNAPIGETITWNNPETNHYGEITPIHDGLDKNGAYCREYEQTVYIGGKAESAYGTACRKPDGTWQIIN